MSSKHTPNYNLSQWEKTDQVLMEDFNADNAKIDAALNGLRSSLNGKASTSALSGLQSTVSGLSTTLGSKGNCILYTTTYRGTGKYGEENPSSLTFPHRPMVVFLVSGRSRLTLVRGAASWCDTQGGGSGVVDVTWGERSVQWYGLTAAAQMSGGCSVVALLDAEH